jgi:hypothetical protein
VINLRFFGGNGGVPVDELGEDSAQCLDTQRERGDIQQKDIRDVSGEHTTYTNKHQTNESARPSCASGLKIRKTFVRKYNCFVWNVMS